MSLIGSRKKRDLLSVDVRIGGTKAAYPPYLGRTVWKSRPPDSTEGCIPVATYNSVFLSWHRMRRTGTEVANHPLMLFSASRASTTVGLSSNCDFNLLTRHFPNCA